MNDSTVFPKNAGKADFWLLVFVLGSVAGMLEVMGGGLLRDLKFPFTSGLLTGLGFAIIGFAIAIFRKPAAGIAIGVVAVLCKQLTVPLMHVSVMCGANSCLAVMLEYGALTGIAGIMGAGLSGKTHRRVLAGGSAALISALAFYYIGMRFAPCAYLLSFRETGVLSFVAKEGSSWIAASAILFPVGWHLGHRSADTVLGYMAMKPKAAHAGAAMAAIACWAVSAIGIAQGI